ncbi:MULTISPECIES: ComEA family DNA-binding protein [unclassified Pseudomonas]|uniref:ComEA family DNA-binding protein n=1 Tax=unclassified Pseudomonas TaxID=196821 RepID=UPI00111ADAAF|nr:MULTISPECIES: ComEA family DNA-binding protein [unclassified Pseudomonas]MBI6953032.1 ComEA family DNA-binding protein [Pseudomonas sp. CCOS 191]
MRHNIFTALLTAIAASFTLGAGAVQNTPMVAELPSAAVTAEQGVGKLNINTADASTLQRELSGVGQSKSEAIVAYRDNNGDFATVEELLEVEGIGKAILERNRDKLTVN